jgi:hypothetical protein
VTARNRRFDPAAAALSAIENASRKPAARRDLSGCSRPARAILRTCARCSAMSIFIRSAGLPHTLCRLAALFAIDNRTLARSYVHARRNVAAANPELDEFAAQFDFVNPPQERRHCPNPSVRRPMR